MNGILILLALIAATADQSSDVLMEVGPQEVTLSEFENIFQKNNNLEEATEQELDDYLELFIKFKMKVLDAEQMSLDTFESFQKELSGYRKQLARPYLTDKQAEEELLLEAYNRMLLEVRASHILILVDENAMPKDTLSAYQKISSIRNKILKGEDFTLVAKSVSEDPSAKQNGGDLGYFSAFRMVYPFETAAFNTLKGEISKPFRTRFGYHIVKVTDKRPSRGQVKVAHIMIENSEKSNNKAKEVAQQKLDQLIDFFDQGKSFSDLVRFSDDKSSSDKGGELPWFGTGQMVSEFEDAAFSLKKKGDISEPIKTIYGWHILKLIDKKDIESFDQLKSDIQRKIKRDSRSNKGREVLVNKIKKDNNFRENRSNLEVFFNMSFEDIRSFKSSNLLEKYLFYLNGRKFLQSDFLTYIENNKTPIDQTKVVSVINEMYVDWVEETCILLEDSQLEKKYPEFQSLMKEYRDGILLFDLMDQKVWGKAIKDTIGLKKYYESTQDTYLWGPRLKASIFTCLNSSISKKARELISSQNLPINGLKRGSLGELVRRLQAYLNIKSDGIFGPETESAVKLWQSSHKLDSDGLIGLETWSSMGLDIMDYEQIKNIINNDNPLNIQVETGRFLKGENSFLDSVEWSKGLTEDQLEEDIVVFALIDDLLGVTPKTFKEARGQVIANYQDYLESVWIQDLESRYPVIINNKLLERIIKQK